MGPSGADPDILKGVWDYLKKYDENRITYHAPYKKIFPDFQILTGKRGKYKTRGSPPVIMVVFICQTTTESNSLYAGAS